MNNPKPLNAVNPPSTPQRPVGGQMSQGHPGQEQIDVADLLDRLVCATETIAFLVERMAVKQGIIKEDEANYDADGAR